MIAFVAPGSLRQLTGGYLYDAHVADGLRRLGRRVVVKQVSERFPSPTAADLREAERVLASIPDGTVTIVDGLAGGAMPDQIGREASRLRFIALVHHPLAFETGVARGEAGRLFALERRTLHHVHRVVVTSRRTARLLVREFGVRSKRIACVEPGTDRLPIARGTGRHALLCVATLTPRKGHVTLIRALARVADLEWRLTCLGSLVRSPETVKQIRREIRKAGLARRISLAGETASPARLRRCYGSADLFVLPTEYEGYGMAVAEAVASGLPVVSTPTGAIPQLVGADAGVLVPPGDVAALAAVLRRVLSDDRVLARMQAAARRRRKTLRSWRRTVTEFNDVIRSVAAG